MGSRADGERGAVYRIVRVLEVWQADRYEVELALGLGISAAVTLQVQGVVGVPVRPPEGEIERDAARRLLAGAAELTARPIRQPEGRGAWLAEVWLDGAPLAAELVARGLVAKAGGVS